MTTDLRRYRRRLPHWRVAGGIYFVTWRIARDAPDLDAAERDFILTSLRHFDGVRFTLHAVVVMNDHVHALVEPRDGFALERIVQTWKSYTARQLPSRVGRLWQPEYWDHIVRDQREFDEYLDYILTNPARRWPGVDGYPWVWLCPPEPA